MPPLCSEAVYPLNSIRCRTDRQGSITFIPNPSGPSQRAVTGAQKDRLDQAKLFALHVKIAMSINSAAGLKKKKNSTFSLEGNF